MLERFGGIFLYVEYILRVLLLVIMNLCISFMNVIIILGSVLNTFSFSVYVSLKDTFETSMLAVVMRVSSLSEQSLSSGCRFVTCFTYLRQCCGFLPKHLHYRSLFITGSNSLETACVEKDGSNYCIGIYYGLPSKSKNMQCSVF